LAAVYQAYPQRLKTLFAVVSKHHAIETYKSVEMKVCAMCNIQYRYSASVSGSCVAEKKGPVHTEQKAEQVLLF
jgi:hypothetical protein